MTSWQMQGVALYLRLNQKRRFSTPERAERALEALTGNPSPPRRLRKRHEVVERTVHGFRVYRVCPRNGISSGHQTVVYLHGGAYVAEIRPQHWTFVSRLADAGCRVEVPIYGLAPAHTHREAIDLLTAVYEELLHDGEPAAIALAGDSAGAGLALAFTQALIGRRPLPRRVVLISPWLDATLANPAVAAAERRDPWLSAVGLRAAGRSWAGSDGPEIPAVSPLNGDLGGLPPLTVLIGTRDLLHPDVLVLRDRCAAAGVAVDLEVIQGAVHVYPLTPTPEGKSASRRLVRLLAGPEHR